MSRIAHRVQASRHSRHRHDSDATAFYSLSRLKELIGQSQPHQEPRSTGHEVVFGRFVLMTFPVVNSLPSTQLSGQSFLRSFSAGGSRPTFVGRVTQDLECSRKFEAVLCCFFSNLRHHDFDTTTCKYDTADSITPTVPRNTDS